MPLTLAIAALASIGMVAAATAGAVAHTQKGGPGAFDHIYVIVLENHSQTSVIGDPNMPNLNNLADHNGVAMQYYGVTHPSMPNYLAMIGGDTYGINNDDDTSVVNLDRRNLVDQLEAKGISWSAYFQDLPANKLDSYGPSAADPLYAKKHNPFVLYDDITSNPARMANIKDYSALAGDLTAHGAPQFSFIIPNQCNDLHGGIYDVIAGHPETPCGYNSTTNDAADVHLKQNADAFIQQTVDTIRNSPAWTPRSAIVIVADENDYDGSNEVTDHWATADGCCDSPYLQAGTISETWPGGTYGGGLVPAVVITGKGKHIVDNTPYNHYSLLRTIEDNWHLGHLGYSGDTQNGVVPMWKVFGRGGNPN